MAYGQLLEGKLSDNVHYWKTFYLDSTINNITINNIAKPLFLMMSFVIGKIANLSL